MNGGYRESAAEDRSILVVAFAGKVFGIAPADGSVRWEHSVAFAGAVELQIQGGRVFASTGATLCCLDYATGRLLGKVQVPDRYKGRPSMVIEGDRLYLGSQGEVTCFRLSDGAALWTQGLEGKGLGRVALGFPGNVRQADDAGTR